MATSQEYMQKLESMGSMPDYKSVISQAYDKPVVKGVVNNIANLESQYLPTVFDTFVNQGTGAKDMSVAAKMARLGQNLGRLTSKANAGANVLNFYDQTTTGLANRAAQDDQMNRQNLQFLAQMQMQKEENEKQRQAAAAQASAGAFDMDEFLRRLGIGDTTDTNNPNPTGGEPSITIDVPDTPAPGMKKEGLLWNMVPGNNQINMWKQNNSPAAMIEQQLVDQLKQKNFGNNKQNMDYVFDTLNPLYGKGTITNPQYKALINQFSQMYEPGNYY